MAKAIGMIDLKPEDEASKVAVNYIADTSSGIRIANEDPSESATYQYQTPDSTEFYVDTVKRCVINGDGMDIYNIDGESIAKFSGAGVRVGAENGQSFRVTKDSIVSRNADGSEFFKIESSNETVTTDVQVETEQTISSNSHRTTVDGALVIDPDVEFYIPELTMNIVIDGANNDCVESYTIEGGGTLSVTELEEYRQQLGKPRQVLSISFDDTITIPYGTSAIESRSFTATIVGTAGTKYELFVRAKVVYNGVLIIDLDNLVYMTGHPELSTYRFSYISGDKSEGLLVHSKSYTISSIRISGSSTKAPSFTLGIRSGEEGALSTVIGRNLYATDDQFAIGKFNIRDVGDNVFIVGNGDGEIERSNAFTVSWDGDAKVYVDETETPASAGEPPTDGDLAAVITALNWADYVYVDS